MMSSRIFLAIQTVLCVVGFLAFLRMREARIAALDSKDIRKRSEQLAGEIAELRDSKSIADDGRKEGNITNVQLVGLARQCGIAESQIRNIERFTPTAAVNADYEEQLVSLQLSQISLKKAIEFILRIQSEQPSYVPTSLSLTPGFSSRRTPPSASTNRRETGSEANPERWNAQLTLTQLVFVATRSRDRGPVP